MPHCAPRRGVRGRADLRVERQGALRQVWNACPTGAACTEGECVCPSGTTACGGACVDTQRSDAHCGRCGITCVAPSTCYRGGCAVPICPSSCTSHSQCAPCASPGDTGSYCCIRPVPLHERRVWLAPGRFGVRLLLDAPPVDVGPG